MGHAGSSLRHTRSFIAARALLWRIGFSLVVALRLQGTWAPEHMGPLVFSRRALLLRCTSSVVAAHGLSCPVACGILVPRPGIEPVSPALEGGFFTTGPREVPRYFLNEKKTLIFTHIFAISRAFHSFV